MSANQPDGDERGGFALILVVWLLVLIGAIGAYVVANGRSESAIAFNVHAAASAEALADAGIARIVFNQGDPDISNRWKLDGEPHRISTPVGSIVIRLEDESLKINPNLASDALLAALFEVSGVEHGAARRLGAAVADWVGKQDANRPGSPTLDQYRAAGRSYGPPHAPLESLDELQLVLGMTPQILASVRPYLTIYTDAAAPDAKLASGMVGRAIALAARASQEGGDEQDAASPAQTQPPAPATPAPSPAPGPPGMPGATKPESQEGPLISAQITTRSREGGVFVRTAVLRLKPDSPKDYSVLDWQRGTQDDQGSAKVSD